MHVRECRRFMLDFMRRCVFEACQNPIHNAMHGTLAGISERCLLLRLSFRSNTIQLRLEDVRADSCNIWRKLSTLVNKASKTVFTVKQSIVFNHVTETCWIYITGRSILHLKRRKTPICEQNACFGHL